MMCKKPLYGYMRQDIHGRKGAHIPKKTGGTFMTDRELRLQIEDRINEICTILAKGKDVELRKDANGVKILAVDKRVVK